MQFSVVIPTYNRSAYLRDALDSVLEQDYAQREILVVDDGSTDDTAEALEPYHGCVRYLRQANAGVAAARNLGIREARGEIVGFLDSDDRWAQGTLRKVAAAFESRSCGYVSIMARETDATGRPTNTVYGKKSPGERYSTTSLLLDDCGGCSWFFVRRHLLEQVGGYDESLAAAEEIDLSVRLSFITEMVALREPLLLRRKHAGNLSNDMALNARMWLRLLRKLEREQPEFVAAHRDVIRRATAKERLRLGRELLATVPADPPALHEARGMLKKSLRAAPSRRALTYLAWSWLAPRSYAGWRRRERQRQS